MVKNSPARISRSMPATATTPPYFLVRPARRMSDEEPSIPRHVIRAGHNPQDNHSRARLDETEYGTPRS